MNKLKQTAKWEYECLIRDLKGQGERNAVKDLKNTGFDEWFKYVFLVDEAWLEIRQNYNLK